MTDLRIGASGLRAVSGESGPQPQADHDSKRAQELLNLIAGRPRYPVSGPLDTQTRDAIRAFQVSAGTAETGEPETGGS